MKYADVTEVKLKDLDHPTATTIENEIKRHGNNIDDIKRITALDMFTYHKGNEVLGIGGLEASRVVIGEKHILTRFAGYRFIIELTNQRIPIRIFLDVNGKQLPGYREYAPPRD